MYREIKKRKIILDNRRPFREEAARLLREMDEADIVYSSLRLDGSMLSRQAVERILRGEFLVEASISLHAVVANLQEAVRLLRDMEEMKVYLTEAAIRKLWGAVERSQPVEYRKSNPVLRMLEYVPPHFKEIEEQMELLFQWYHGGAQTTDPIEKAALLHNKLVEIYPFEAGSEAIARLAAQYHLMAAGFPPVFWNCSETEYYDAIRAYLKTEDTGPVYEMLVRGVYNKMEVMMQLTAER